MHKNKIANLRLSATGTNYPIGWRMSRTLILVDARDVFYGHKIRLDFCLSCSFFE